MTSNLKKFGIAAAGLATVLGGGFTPANDFALASPAQAQEQTILPSQMSNGQCASKAAVLDGLDKEGQYILVAADWVRANGNTGNLYTTKFAFTANKDFSKGYHINSNGPDQLCKASELKSPKLFNATKGEVDSRAFYKPVSVSDHGTLNQVINTSQQNASELPMLQSSTSTPGITATVLGNISGGKGVLLLSNPNGKVQTIIGLENVRYSQTALNTLGNRIQTASLDPK